MLNSLIEEINNFNNNIKEVMNNGLVLDLDVLALVVLDFLCY